MAERVLRSVRGIDLRGVADSVEGLLKVKSDVLGFVRVLQRWLWSDFLCNLAISLSPHLVLRINTLIESAVFISD